MKSQAQAKVTRLTKTEQLYKLEAVLNEDDAKHVTNWLRMVDGSPMRHGYLSSGLRNLLKALEYVDL